MIKYPSSDFDHDHQDRHDHDGPRLTATTAKTKTELGVAEPLGGVSLRAARVACGSDDPLARSNADVFQEELALGAESSLAFDDYLSEAAKVCREENEARDNSGANWRSPLFEFTRLVKDHPYVQEMVREGKPAQAFRWVTFTIGTWRVPKTECWDHWFDVNHDDAEAEFIAVWNYTKISPRLNPLGNAAEWARRSPLNLGSKLGDLRPENYGAFVSLVGWLQVVRRDQHILIPVEKVAEPLCVSDRTISTYIEWAVEDKLLKRTKAYQHRKNGNADDASAEYRFHVARFPQLLDRAAPGSAEAFQKAVHVDHQDRRRSKTGKRHPRPTPEQRAQEPVPGPPQTPDAQPEQDQGGEVDAPRDPAGFVMWWAAWMQTPWEGGTPEEIESRRKVCLGDWTFFGWETHTEVLLDRLTMARGTLDWTEGDEHPDPLLWLGEQMDETRTELTRGNAEAA